MADICSRFVINHYKLRDRALEAVKVSLEGGERRAVSRGTAARTLAEPGQTANLCCRAQEWLEALDIALVAEFPKGTRAQEGTLRLYSGYQPTSNRFQDALKKALKSR